MRKGTLLLISLALVTTMLTACTNFPIGPNQPQTPGNTIKWTTVSTDWMRIDIPTTWSWSYSDEYLGDIEILNEDGSVRIFVGYLIAGDPEIYLKENPSKPFTFSTGTIGYMLEFADRILWLNPEMFLGSGVCLYLDDGRSTYTKNENVILGIAKSYQSN